MKASDLLGVLAIRTAPSKMNDSSYMTRPILITEVTDTHIYYEYPSSVDDDKFIVSSLDKSWLDDNWTEYLPKRQGQTIRAAKSKVESELKVLLLVTKELRDAQKNYMADRGNETLGKLVEVKAKLVDLVIEGIEKE